MMACIALLISLLGRPGLQIKDFNYRQNYETNLAKVSSLDVKRYAKAKENCIRIHLVSLFISGGESVSEARMSVCSSSTV